MPIEAQYQRRVGTGPRQSGRKDRRRVVLGDDPVRLASNVLSGKAVAGLYQGDCVSLLKALPDGSVDVTVTSPPYCMKRAYEPGEGLDEFIGAHEEILPEVYRITKTGGSICWQVGYHVRLQHQYPLDYAVFRILERFDDLKLRNRIIWTFGHGPHCSVRFSGRHEVILWFTKGDDHYFDLDSVRIPQKYPGKKHYKGPKKGTFSSNPLGKNPGDVWDIPQVKAAHIEKACHPCQFPVAIPQRLVRALSPRDGVVCDPFAGVASTGVAALLEERRFLGAEKEGNYIKAAYERLQQTMDGTVRYRPPNRPVVEPSPSSSVARVPAGFWRRA